MSRIGSVIFLGTQTRRSRAKQDSGAEANGRHETVQQDFSYTKTQLQNIIAGNDGLKRCGTRGIIFRAR